MQRVVTDIAKILFWKQFTTKAYSVCGANGLSLILQRYYFESNSQLLDAKSFGLRSCHWYCKDTILKAIHNYCHKVSYLEEVVTDIAKILFWKQFTTSPKYLDNVA